jgi:CPA2 family monovalent cation:H+ antiporter-2
MEPLGFLGDLLAAFAVAGVIVLLFHRVRLPPVVGLLVAGMVMGPYGLSLIHDVHRVETLAEIGVVVLLFSVGLEFSLQRLAGMSRLMVRVGIPQVAICTIVGTAGTWIPFGDVRPALLAGMLLAMSSTAVVFKLLSDRGELTAPQGNLSAAVLLIQNLLVVVCMVILPLLAAQEQAAQSVWRSLGLGAVVVIALLAAGRWVLPLVLYHVVRTHNRELLLIVLVLVCLGSSAVTALMRWSLALGAFLAGLALSESEYASQTLAEVLPFRDTLASLFFISIGMLLDLSFLMQNLLFVACLVVAVINVKSIAAALPAMLAGYPLRIALLAGLALAQVGEFSLILADRGQALGLLTREQYQVFLATAVLTVTPTPFLIMAGPWLGNCFDQIKFLDRWHRQAQRELPAVVKARNHVIIIGYGLNGRNLARVLRAVDIKHVVLDLNPETVRQARRAGEPVSFGDCTRPHVLEHLCIGAARPLVIAISDPVSSRRAVAHARRLNPNLTIIVRTRYLLEIDELSRLGANVIIPEEFETSVEIFARVLRGYDIPRNVILDLIERVRSDHYELLRDVNPAMAKVELPFDILGLMEVETCLIRAGSPVEGSTLGQLRLRSSTGATVIGVRRQGELQVNPGADFASQAGDIAILVGDRLQIDRAHLALDPFLSAVDRAPASEKETQP